MIPTLKSYLFRQPCEVRKGTTNDSEIFQRYVPFIEQMSYLVHKARWGKNFQSDTVTMTEWQEIDKHTCPYVCLFLVIVTVALTVKYSKDMNKHSLNKCLTLFTKQDEVRITACIFVYFLSICHCLCGHFDCEMYHSLNKCLTFFT